ncbi:hypothetical protein Tco_0013606 [Tanacetum coccineum]
MLLAHLAIGAFIESPLNTVGQFIGIGATGSEPLSSLQMGTELLRSKPPTLGEAFSLARITKARFEETTFYEGLFSNPCEGLGVEGTHSMAEPKRMMVIKSCGEEKFRKLKELDKESKDKNVERDAEKEGEPNILATFGSDRGVGSDTPVVNEGRLPRRCVADT